MAHIVPLQFQAGDSNLNNYIRKVSKVEEEDTVLRLFFGEVRQSFRHSARFPVQWNPDGMEHNQCVKWYLALRQVQAFGVPAKENLLKSECRLGVEAEDAESVCANLAALDDTVAAPVGGVLQEQSGQEAQEKKKFLVEDQLCFDVVLGPNSSLSFRTRRAAMTVSVAIRSVTPLTLTTTTPPSLNYRVTANVRLPGFRCHYSDTELDQLLANPGDFIRNVLWVAMDTL